MTISMIGRRAGEHAADELRIPEWDLADRMTKALRISGIGVQEMADGYGVSRVTVGRWINGRTKPSRSVLMIWADACGVDFQWLETGEASPEAVRLHNLRGCRDSNPRPSDP